jgi:hypothetical protein
MKKTFSFQSTEACSTPVKDKLVKMSCCFWPSLFFGVCLMHFVLFSFLMGKVQSSGLWSLLLCLKLNLATFLNGTLFLTEFCPIFKTVRTLNCRDSAACPFSS